MSGRILVIGDGDFTYSVALAKENQRIGSAVITATSLDSKNLVETKYSLAEANLLELSLHPDVCVTHGLDISKLGSLGNERMLDSIIWNFPFPAYSSRASNQEGSALLTSLFRNCCMSLKQKAIFTLHL